MNDLKEAEAYIVHLYKQFGKVEGILSDLLSDRGEDALIEIQLNKALMIIRSS
jgi:hypothetical protein